MYDITPLTTAFRTLEHVTALFQGYNTRVSTGGVRTLSDIGGLVLIMFNGRLTYRVQTDFGLLFGD